MKKKKLIFHNWTDLAEVKSVDGAKVSDVEVLRVGVIQDRDLEINQKMLEEYVKNFKANVYGTEIQVNLEHNRGSEAAGWVKNLFVDGDCLMATVEWTELGMEKIEKKLFKFVSAELASRYPHHKSGKLVSNVFIGLALTNTPALKGQEALALEEQINKLISNAHMFKTFLQSLKERKVVSKEDKALMNTMLEELPVEEQEEVKADVAEVEAKPEEEKKEEEKKEEKKEGEENLKDNVQFKALQEQNVQLSEKLKKIELKEKSVKDYLLSTNRKVGFQEADLDEVVTFVSTLSEEQVKGFDQLFTKLRAVDLEVKGTSKTTEELTEEKAYEEADKEAAQRADATKRPLADCLSEVYKERGLAK